MPQGKQVSESKKEESRAQANDSIDTRHKRREMEQRAPASTPYVNSFDCKKPIVNTCPLKTQAPVDKTTKLLMGVKKELVESEKKQKEIAEKATQKQKDKKAHENYKENNKLSVLTIEAFKVKDDKQLSEIIATNHKGAITRACEKNNYCIAVRETGKSSIDRIKKGAKAKPHTILGKSIKKSSLANSIYGEESQSTLAELKGSSSPEVREALAHLQEAHSDVFKASAKEDFSQQIRNAHLEGYVGEWQLIRTGLPKRKDNKEIAHKDGVEELVFTKLIGLRIDGYESTLNELIEIESNKLPPIAKQEVKKTITGDYPVGRKPSPPYSKEIQELDELKEELATKAKPCESGAYLPLRECLTNQGLVEKLKKNRLLYTGDYDLHEAYVNTGGGRGYRQIMEATEEKVKLLNDLNAEITQDDPLRSGHAALNDAGTAIHLKGAYAMFQHGDQATYVTNQLFEAKSRGEGKAKLVPSVASEDPGTIAWCHCGEWYITRSALEHDKLRKHFSLIAPSAWSEQHKEKLASGNSRTQETTSVPRLPFITTKH